jgi:hypothetical protein
MLRYPENMGRYFREEKKKKIGSRCVCVGKQVGTHEGGKGKWKSGRKREEDKMNTIVTRRAMQVLFLELYGVLCVLLHW